MRYIDLATTGSRRQQKSRRRGKLWGKVVLGIVILFGLLALAERVFSVNLSPVSVFSQIVSGGSLQQDEGRTNLLILGLDQRSPGSYQTGILTDTIIVGSWERKSGNLTLVSIPRDLWVKLRDGYFAKINSAFSVGGVELVQQIASEVLGIPIHYHVVIGFEAFEQAIDTLGGVSLEVTESFTDPYYPIAGRENDTCGLNVEEILSDKIDQAKAEGEEDPEVVLTQFDFPCRFETVSFPVGPQEMSGITALKYARSRYGDGNQGSDFARAKRQQRVIAAVAEKTLSWETLTNPNKVKELYETYQEHVDTDVSLGHVLELYELAQKVSLGEVASVVLSNGINDDAAGDLLYVPRDRELYGGAYVLIPKAGDYSQVHAFIQNLLFGER